MPTQNIKLPDGRTVPVNLPDGATPTQIEEFLNGPEFAASVPKTGPTVPNAGTPAPEKRSLGGFLMNVPKSAGKLVSDVASVITNPAAAVTGIATVAGGGIEKLQKAMGLPDPSGGKNIPTFDAFTDHFKRRYGGMEEIKTTAYEDPVGFLTDLSAVFTGGASAAGRVGLTSASKALTTAARVTDPILVASKAVAPIAKNVVAPILGKTTGTGTETILTAAKGSPEFEKGLRAAVSHEDIVTDVRKAVSDLADQRQSAYQDQLAKLPPVQVTTKPVLATLRQNLADFGVKVKQVVDDKGNVTFEAQFGGPLNKITDSAEQAAIQAVIDDVAKHTMKNGQPVALDALAMDALKQRLGQRLGSGSRADKIVTAAKDAARNVLDQSVPGYAEMTKDYAEASALLDKITTEFSTKGGSAKTGAGIRKLTNALNQRNEFRRTLIETMDAELGTNIKGALAGAEMSSIAPRGLMGSAFGAGGVAAFFNPKILAALAVSSPRFVGEALLAIAKARKSRAGMPKLPLQDTPAVAAAGASAAGVAADIAGIQ